MNPFEEALKGAVSTVDVLHMGAMVPRMIAAAVLGTALALRPWRFILRRPLPKAEMIQAQILLCAAAAVITAVIGDSVAKAFGLVGLGGFVRFRSGLKDPRDAAILFLLIGLGMACGHGALGLAFVGTVFVATLLFILDLVNGEKTDGEILTLSAETEDPAAAEAALRKAFSPQNVVVKRSALDFPNRKLELDLEGLDAGKLAQLLTRAPDLSLRQMKWTVSAHAPVKADKEQREEA